MKFVKHRLKAYGGTSNWLQNQREKAKVRCPAFPDCPKKPSATNPFCLGCKWLKQGLRDLEVKIIEGDKR